MPTDIYICFHSDDKKETENLVVRLDNYYTIQTPVEIQEKDEYLMKNSKLFVCFLSLSFLNEPNCMHRLNCALSLSKRIIILSNETDNIDESFLKTTSSKILKLIFKSNQSNQDQVKKVIDHCLR